MHWKIESSDGAPFRLRKRVRWSEMERREKLPSSEKSFFDADEDRIEVRGHGGLDVYGDMTNRMERYESHQSPLFRQHKDDTNKSFDRDLSSADREGRPSICVGMTG